MKTAKEILRENNGGLTMQNCIDSMEQYKDQFMPKWVSLKDKLPEKHKVVLTYNKQFNHIISNHLNKDGIFENSVNGIYDGFTHWMPLPEKPTV